MKLGIFLIITTLGAFVSCTNNAGQLAEERKENFAALLEKPTEISFEEDAFDFGKVVDGEKVQHTFHFTNTGDKSLVLIDVKGSCGCTVPENWPKAPIQPGETAQIDVTFDSKNRVGIVRKTVRIQANTNPSVTTLTITGEVTEKI
ncbi:DUF1573 domain-containing protein [Putridiphycobacter roseus]|uniref:DUF1573 domain-containing protein n=1 Tax=Putridiphycobacter roseus TaxID=2219161 RepID=A0A2W1MXX5_9FLAO|nr:DUF1573 domain-containing protein [Putridiphycobacter roseus]PZE16030.1 DUF1573 domain-containing protein [Putridiphycobacter roseus]